MLTGLYLQFEEAKTALVGENLKGGFTLTPKNRKGMVSMIVGVPDGMEEQLVRSGIFARIERVPAGAIGMFTGQFQARLGQKRLNAAVV